MKLNFKALLAGPFIAFVLFSFPVYGTMTDTDRTVTVADQLKIDKNVDAVKTSEQKKADFKARKEAYIKSMREGEKKAKEVSKPQKEGLRGNDKPAFPN